MALINHSTKERKTIGVFVSHLGRVWDPEFIVGITDAAETHDLNVICFVGGKPAAIISGKSIDPSPGQMQLSYGLYDIARTEQLAGIIVSGDLGHELDVHEIKPFLENYSYIPLIVNALQVDGIPNLLGDNLRAMRTAIGHLFDVHGYKSIAFIRGPENQVEAEQRFLAYKQELQEHNIPYDESLVLPGLFSIESGRAAVGVLLDERKLAERASVLKVDAIVAANDRMALGAFEALQLRGIQVPGDIALIGFDDIREARAMEVPLTTVRQPFYDMGKQAVELLLRRIDGAEIPENIVIPTQFVVRWSCGCLPVPENDPEINLRASEANRASGETGVVHDLLQAAKLSAESAHTFGSHLVFKQAAAQTWAALNSSLQEPSASRTGVFLKSVETLIAALPVQGNDMVTWHNLVSVLREHALAGISDRNAILNAERLAERASVPAERASVLAERASVLFQQTQVMLGKLSQRYQVLAAIRLDLQEEVLQAFSASMAPAMSLEEIGAAVIRHFPQMGIQRMYVMLYTSMTMPESTLAPPSDKYHLLMQYDEMGIQIPVDQPKWKIGHLIPRGKALENRRYAAIVMPLILAQNRFGFLWIEMNTQDWEIYGRIRNLISSALLRTMLVEQRSLMQKQVEHLLQESQLREMELAIATERAESTAEENARLYTNEQVRRRDAETLSKVARNLSTLLKMDGLPEHILTQLAELLPYERGALIMEEADGPPRVLAQRGLRWVSPGSSTGEDTSASDLLIQIDSCGAYAQIIQTGDPLIIDDVVTFGDNLPGAGLTVAERKEHPSLRKEHPSLGVNHSWMGVPLVSKNKVIGVLSITRPPVAAFSHDDLLLLMTFGTQTAISLENARLYDEVTRFNENLERLVAQRVEELNLAYIKLEQLDKNKTSFIQVTAHELRTPMTVMKGYLGMLKGIPAIQENDSLLQAVDGVLKGTDRLHLVVNSMLDMARLEGQTIIPRLETVVIGLTFQLVQKEYKNDLAARNITLLFEQGINSLPFIQADPQLLQKALDAIIVNAIKFTPDGGSISLGGRVVTDEQLGPCLEIHIRDTGIGIDSANHQVIFEKLFQLGKVELHSSGRTKFKGGGPGLGLAIAASIIKAHNGKIWVESPGCDEEKLPGSTFFIRLALPSNTQPPVS